MKTKLLWVVFAILFSVNNSSRAQIVTTITAPGDDYVVPYGSFPNEPLVKIVVEKVDPSQVKIGFGWTDNNWLLPTGHLENGSIASFVTALLPGGYANSRSEGGSTTISYISDPWVGVDQVATTESPHLTSFNGTITAQSVVNLKLSSVFANYYDEIIKLENGIEVASIGLNQAEYAISESGSYRLSTSSGSSSPLENLDFNVVITGQREVDLTISNNIATVQSAGQYRIPTSWIESQPTNTTLDPFVIKVVAEYGIAGVEIGYDTNVFDMVGGTSCPIGHPQDGQSASYISASLPGSYGIILKKRSTGSVWNIRYIVSYISDPWIKVDGAVVTGKEHLRDFYDTLQDLIVINAESLVELELSSVFANSSYSKGVYKVEGENYILVNQVNGSYRIESSGDYLLTTRSGSGSPIEDVYFKVVITGSSGSGIVEAEKEKLFIYPSFVQSMVFLQSESPVKRVAIHAVSGNKVIERVGDVREIEVSSLHSGMYIVRGIFENGNTLSQKIVKY